tara:strand:+ start:5114 stop:5872 length:759 start_codon:yes stop_codon:yes gene_type:complete
MSGNNTTAEKSDGKPVVTVIIPCHNHADMVCDAIQSVIEQDYESKNIAVVDDGSSDNPSKAIEERFSLDGSSSVEINIIKNESPTGPSAARNSAIEFMWDKSDVFMMLDADDRYLPGKISKSVEKYLEHPDSVGIVYTDAIIQNVNKGTKIYEYRMPFSREAVEKECIISNTPLVSKQAIGACGAYDPTMRTCEDWDLHLRITESFVAVHIPEALHIYSVTGKNSSDVVPEEVWQKNWAIIRQKIMSRKNGV